MFLPSHQRRSFDLYYVKFYIFLSLSIYVYSSSFESKITVTPDCPSRPLSSKIPASQLPQLPSFIQNVRNVYSYVCTVSFSICQTIPPLPPTLPSASFCPSPKMKFSNSIRFHPSFAAGGLGKKPTAIR